MGNKKKKGGQPQQPKNQKKKNKQKKAMKDEPNLVRLREQLLSIQAELICIALEDQQPEPQIMEAIDEPTIEQEPEPAVYEEPEQQLKNFEEEESANQIKQEATYVETGDS